MVILNVASPADRAGIHRDAAVGGDGHLHQVEWSRRRSGLNLSVRGVYRAVAGAVQQLTPRYSRLLSSGGSQSHRSGLPALSRVRADDPGATWAARGRQAPLSAVAEEESGLGPSGAGGATAPGFATITVPCMNGWI